MKNYFLTLLIISTSSLLTPAASLGMEPTSSTQSNIPSPRFILLSNCKGIQGAIKNGMNINVPLSQKEILDLKTKKALADEGDTPLIFTLRNIYLAAAQVLLEHGANPNILDSKGKSPLFHACNLKLESQDIVLELLAMGADAKDLHIPDYNRAVLTWSNLINAVLSNNSQALQEALNNNPDHSTVLTALKIALGQAHLETALLLFDYATHHQLLTISMCATFLSKISLIATQTRSPEKKAHYEQLYEQLHAFILSKKDFCMCSKESASSSSSQSASNTLPARQVTAPIQIIQSTALTAVNNNRASQERLLITQQLINSRDNTSQTSLTVSQQPLILPATEPTSPTQSSLSSWKFVDFSNTDEIESVINKDIDITIPLTTTEVMSQKMTKPYKVEEGDTPLIIALRNNFLETALSLLDYGANPNIPDSQGNMPLSYAYNLKLDTLEIILKLLIVGAQTSSLHSTPQNKNLLTWPNLYNEVLSDNTEALEQVLKAGSDDIETIIRALQLALGQARIKTATVLLDYLISKEILEVNSYLHLMISMFRLVMQATSEEKKAQYELLRALIHQKFAENISDKLPIPQQTQEILFKLTTAEYTTTTAWEKFIYSIVMDTLSLDNPDNVKKALEEDHLNLNTPDAGGFTPVHYAALSCSNPAIIKLLVKLGADITSRDSNGNIPAKLAISLRRPNDIITSLMTPQQLILLGASRGKLALIEQAIKQNVNVNTRFANGRTPLSYASEQGHLETIMRLIKLGASTTAKDSAGKTPFDYLPLSSSANNELKDYLVSRSKTISQPNLSFSLESSSSTFTTRSITAPVQVSSPGTGNSATSETPNTGSQPIHLGTISQVLPTVVSQQVTTSPSSASIITTQSTTIPAQSSSTQIIQSTANNNRVSQERLLITQQLINSRNVSQTSSSTNRSGPEKTTKKQKSSTKNFKETKHSTKKQKISLEVPSEQREPSVLLPQTMVPQNSAIRTDFVWHPLMYAYNPSSSNTQEILEQPRRLRPLLPRIATTPGFAPTELRLASQTPSTSSVLSSTSSNSK